MPVDPQTAAAAAEAAYSGAKKLGSWLGIGGGDKSRKAEGKSMEQLGWLRVKQPGPLWNQFLAVIGLELKRSPDQYLWRNAAAPGFVAATIGATGQDEWDRQLGPRWGLTRPSQSAKEDWVLLLAEDAGTVVPIGAWNEAEELPAAGDLLALRGQAEGRAPGATVGYGNASAMSVAYGRNMPGVQLTWADRVLQLFGLKPRARYGIDQPGARKSGSAGAPKVGSLAGFKGGVTTKVAGKAKVTIGAFADQTIQALTTAYQKADKGSEAQKAAAQALADFVNSKPGSKKMTVREMSGTWVPVPQA